MRADVTFAQRWASLIAILIAVLAGSAVASRAATTPEESGTSPALSSLKVPAHPAVPAAELPPSADQARLVHETMRVLLECVKQQSLQALHDRAASPLREQVGLAELQKAFATVLALPVKGRPSDGLKPSFAPAEDLQDGVAFTVRGFYPTRPSRLRFDITFYRDGPEWRWIAMSVSVVPAKGGAGGTRPGS